ncbi:hypothetical protein Q3G72_029982 [Acer saccharum]|nr:hypothetical protein Q3G72_029982 [Acer saccharum]
MRPERRLTMQGRRGGNISGCQEWQTSGGRGKAVVTEEKLNSRVDDKGPRDVVDGLDESIGLGLGNLNEHASSLKEIEILGFGCLVVADPALNRLGKDSQVQTDGKKKSGARR